MAKVRTRAQDGPDGDWAGDPLNPPSAPKTRSRLSRFVAEFLRLPLLMMAGAAVLAVLVSIADAHAAPGVPWRKVAEVVVPGKDAQSFLSTVATSLMTVTSITFSVLVVAVQQTASSFSAVVFDQFLRRRANQIYFGFFTAITMFTFVVLGLARPHPNPVYGAVVTLVLVVVGLVVLLLLVHGTVDQMRPQTVVRFIHDLALEARQRELELLGRTRAHRRTDPATRSRIVRLDDNGYVTRIRVDALAAIAKRIGDDAEVIVDAALGRFVVYGDPAVHLVGVDADSDRWDDDVRRAFALDDIRDVQIETGYAIDELSNIAWTNATSAKQSPNAAVAAIRSLEDLAGRWLIAGERDRSEISLRRDSSPVVYKDGAVEQVLSALAASIVATAESRQADTCAEILFAFAGLAPRLRTADDRTAFDRALTTSLPAVVQQIELPRLADALQELDAVLDGDGETGRRVRRARELLAAANDDLAASSRASEGKAHPR
ncbi:DUF2254 family protein [Amnibacterium sp.]|uniref:DUF2254 family protein n=1 Tax=Amnibacterium sp. TaxID=1872496 RepID=UPI003F7CAF98